MSGGRSVGTQYVAGRKGDGDRRLEHDSPQRRNFSAAGGLYGDPGGGRLRRAREDRRPSARSRIRRHHDAAARRLSDVRAHQEERSEERRVGKECRYGWRRDHEKKSDEDERGGE